MIDVIKDFLSPKRFGVIAYMCLVIHFLFGVACIGVTVELRKSEFVRFSCAVDKQGTAAFKSYVEKTCHSIYEQTYNSPVPLYGFVLMSIGFTVLVSVAYSLAVRGYVDNERTDNERTYHGFYVFYTYFFHLVTRVLCGIVFTVLQHEVFYTKGFDTDFNCNLATWDSIYIKRNSTIIGKKNYTSIACRNPTAQEKRLWNVIVSVLNLLTALIILGEVFYLILRRFPFADCGSDYGWSSDAEFVTVHLHRKQYVRGEPEFTSVRNNTIPLLHIPRVNASSDDSDRITGDNTNQQSCTQTMYLSSNRSPYDKVSQNGFQDSIHHYKQQVLKSSHTQVMSYGLNTDLDNIYIDLIINTGRAPHKFFDNMERSEIFDVYMKVPSTSIRLREIKDLFYPNEDTKGSYPRTILAVGRPGIGKTVLSEKIVRDWANEVDEFYTSKIVVFLKFRWFNFEEFKKLSLRMFLRYGTRLGEEELERIFNVILREPQRVILIFDGMDEFDGNVENCVEQSRLLSNDPDACMSGMSLFFKLACGQMLQGATILLTSRPIADHFYSSMRFDRSVEILGFTEEKIEEYVIRFCENIGEEEYKLKIWNHIGSSSELLNLCYIPVNCYIVCVTLSGYLVESRNDRDSLPTTLTELYSAAIDFFSEKHNRISGETSKQMAINLQKLAYNGIENGKLVFGKHIFSEPMKKSGLVNSSSNPIFPVQTQFCFIHLTIQEFLAAQHVTETLKPDEIETFISSHAEDVKWHLVLQFIAGLLGEKIKIFGSDYNDCILAFTTALAIPADGRIDFLDYVNLIVMKCLKEVGDEDIVRSTCKKTDFDRVVTYIGNFALISISDWEAVVFVFRHLNNLKSFRMGGISRDFKYFKSVLKLLQEKCFEELDITTLTQTSEKLDNQQILDALASSKCKLNHEHFKLKNLKLGTGINDDSVAKLCTFIKNGHLSYVQKLDLYCNHITSDGMSKLCEVLINEPCRELVYLSLTGNPIGNDGVRSLCNALIHGECCLNYLCLRNCSLTAECITCLNEVLCDRNCKSSSSSLHKNETSAKDVHRTDEQFTLILAANAIGDAGVSRLCTESLRQEQCRLTHLDLERCSLTGNCVPVLCEALKDEHCKLSKLILDRNGVGDDGVRMLCYDALKEEQCKLTYVGLNNCRLTDHCIQCLCDTLKDANCKLTYLSLDSNKFTQEGEILLEEVKDSKNCKARGFNIGMHLGD